MYLIVIKSLLQPKKPYKILVKFVILLFKPFYYFYSYIKKNIYVSYKIHKFKNYILPKLDVWGILDNVFFIYFTQLLPRIILLSIFIIDVFWLHKIEIFYYCITIGIIPLLYNLFLYYLQSTLEDDIQELEDKYNLIWVLEEGDNKLGWEHNPLAIHHDTHVSVRAYIDIQYEAFMTYGDNDHFIEYYCEPYCTEHYYKGYQILYKKFIGTLDLEDHKRLRIHFDTLMPKVLIIKTFLEANNTAMKHFYIPQIKLFIIIAYLICWFYILCVSIHTLHELSITLNILTIFGKYSNIKNPFI
jgi:hypothetical protein